MLWYIIIISFLSIIGVLTLACYAFHIMQMSWQIFVLWYKSYTHYDLQLRERFGDWAVITGSTDGVGKQYAMELARRGINVVLISRNPDKLKRVAGEIESKYAVATKIIVADFSRGTVVYSHIEEELRTIPVGILVNNVGILEEYPMRICDVPMERLWEIVNVNIMTAVSMTRMVVPGMMERGRGAVVNISSASGWQPSPLMGVYASTKAFINHFTETLRVEYSDTNINFSYLYPLFISTNLVSFSENLSKGNIFTPDTVSFAKQAINALGTFSRTAGYWSHILKMESFLMLTTWMRTKIVTSIMTELEEEYTKNHFLTRKL